MSNDLYRKEAMEHKTRTLYGDVVLSAPPATWVITLILIAIIAILGALLFFGRVGEGEHAQTILAWLLGH